MKVGMCLPFSLCNREEGRYLKSVPPLSLRVEEQKIGKEF